MSIITTEIAREVLDDPESAFLAAAVMPLLSGDELADRLGVKDPDLRAFIGGGAPVLLPVVVGSWVSSRFRSYELGLLAGVAAWMVEGGGLLGRQILKSVEDQR